MLEHKKTRTKQPLQKNPKKPEQTTKTPSTFNPVTVVDYFWGKKKKVSLKIRKLVKLKEEAKKIKMLTVALETVYKIKMRCSEEMHTTIKRL